LLTIDQSYFFNSIKLTLLAAARAIEAAYRSARQRFARPPTAASAKNLKSPVSGSSHLCCPLFLASIRRLSLALSFHD
jgi:hypothetical protein